MDKTIIDETKLAEVVTYLENMGCYTKEDIDTLTKQPYVKFVIRSMEADKNNANEDKLGR